MNTERMLHLADVIETFDRFDYAHWVRRPNVPLRSFSQIDPARLYDDCGMVGCIGGWATTLAIRENVVSEQHRTLLSEESVGVAINQIATAYLDLDPATAEQVFHGGAMAALGWYRDGGEALNRATGIEAAKLLRGLALGEYTPEMFAPRDVRAARPDRFLRL